MGVGEVSAIARLIKQAMTDRGLEIQSLSSRLGISYEHTRKIVRGQAIPTPHLRSDLAEVLSLEVEELDRLAMEEKRREGLHDVVEAGIRAKDNRLQTFTRVWDRLGDKRRDDLIAIARLWAQDNRDGQD
jgi:transcriptional regulator with XRE-family HTH domain